MKTEKHYYGYTVARGLRSATVWVFDKKTSRRISTVKRSFLPHVEKQVRQDGITAFLKCFGITLAQPASS